MSNILKTKLKTKLNSKYKKSKNIKNNKKCITKKKIMYGAGKSICDLVKNKNINKSSKSTRNINSKVDLASILSTLPSAQSSRRSSRSAALPSAQPSEPPSRRSSALKSLIPNFNKNTLSLIDVDIVNHPENIIKFVIKHQINRFNELDFILRHNPKCIVIVPEDKKNNPGKHALGIGLAKGQWETHEQQANVPFGTYLTQMIKNIDNIIDTLIRKHPNKFFFGSIGDEESKDNTILCNQGEKKGGYKWPSKDVIHLWGASENNWNIQRSNFNIYETGGGQARCFAKQKLGIFGIVTTFHYPDAENAIDSLFQDTTSDLEKYIS